jgi:hypothetical protein
VLLKGHPSPQPLLGESRAHSLLSLVLNPKHVCSTPLTLSDWQLGAHTVDTSDQRIVHLPGYCCTELPKACIYEWNLWLDTSSESSAPPRGQFTANIFSFCRTHFIPPWMQGGPPSTSSTLVVAAAGPAVSTLLGPAIDISDSGGGRYRTCCQNPQGASHRRLQLRWLPLPDLPPAPLRAPAINVSNSGGGRCQTYCQQTLGGPPSTSPTSVVATAGPAANTP